MIIFLALMILASMSTITFGILQFGIVNGNIVLFNNGMGFTLSLIVFLWSIFIFSLTRKDSKEKEYKKDLKEYKEKVENIKKTNEQKFATLRKLLIKERDLIKESNFVANNDFKRMKEAFDEKPKTPEEFEKMRERFGKILSEMAEYYCTDYDDQHLSISDKIMENMLDILSGKEDILPDKPEK